MRILNRTTDGGPKSPVEAFFLFELKKLGSVALLKFNKGGREAYHTHAFNAYTWFLWGDLEEDVLDGAIRRYKRSLKPKFTPSSCNHRVMARKTSWCFTIRGPWAETWTEDREGTQTILGWGRVVLRKT